MTKQLWTKEEEDRLVMMAAQGKTNKQIAAAIGRTERAVAHKYAKLGIKKREPEELKAEEPEDDTGDDSTELQREIRFQASVTDALSNELQREIRFQASVIDTLSNELKAYRGQADGIENKLERQASVINTLSDKLKAYREQAEGIENKLDLEMERTNELTQDVTLMRDAANGLTKTVSIFTGRLYIVELWLSQSRFYRLTHSFRKFAEAHRED